MIEHNNEFKDVIDHYMLPENRSVLERFLRQVKDYFEFNHVLEKDNIVHSLKSRMKNPDHLHHKLNRKKEEGIIITKENLFEKITDLNGIRILHIYQNDIKVIHNEILKKIDEDCDWKLVEEPKAYTWDDEIKRKFSDLGIKTTLKDSLYTSVHYIVAPNNSNTKVTCEIQVRTLFEEIWGEIAHSINYPDENACISCKEQLKVLAKLVATGARLADSIYTTNKLSNDALIS